MLINQHIIPAINTHKKFEKFLKSKLEYGVLMNFQLAQLEPLVYEMKRHSKKVLIHAELIKGLASDEFGAIYLIQSLKVDGIVSSKPKVIEVCKKRGVTAIFRFFLKDAMSLEQSIDLARKTNPDYLEILPGTALDVIDLIRPLIQQPLIFGGLITKESQIRACIERGAVAITTSDDSLWEISI